MKLWHIGIILIGVLALSKSKLPRNVRNNNPLNIEKGDSWEGLAAKQDDPRFARYVDGKHGFRAGAKILASYARRDVVTLEDIIKTWAPPHENDTAGYIDFVADKTDINPWDIVGKSQYPDLMFAMHLVEGGGFTLEEARAGAELALIPDYTYQEAA